VEQLFWNRSKCVSNKEMLVVVILAALAWTKRAERETTVAENTDQLLLGILIK